MSGPARRGGRIVDDAGTATTWSVAEGRRGRRWRWTVVDRQGMLVASHTVELDPAGRFSRLESAAATGLLSLHKVSDGSVHGNRVAERGVDHLHIEAPAPELMLVGGGPIGLAAIAAGLGTKVGPAATLDIIEVLDDLGVRVAECRVRRLPSGRVEARTDRGTRSVALDPSGVPLDDRPHTTSWPLERD